MLIPVGVCDAEHFVDFRVSHSSAVGGHHIPELRGRETTVAILVEHFERLLDFIVVGIRALHLHHFHELGEVDGTIVVFVRLKHTKKGNGKIMNR